MPILNALPARIGLAILVAASVLTGFALFATTAAATEHTGDQMGEEDNGPAANYSGWACGGGRTDPIGVVFRGKRAGPSNVAEAIEDETTWDSSDEGLPGLPPQDLRVHQANGSYKCRPNDAERAESGFGPNSRFHIRLWYVPGSAGGGEVKTVGTPHHEEWLFEDPTGGNNECGGPISFPLPFVVPFLTGVTWGVGNHAVNEGGVGQEKDSGFDRARLELRNRFEGDYPVNKEFWGNTEEMQQCSHDWAGSDGNGIIVWVNRAVHPRWKKNSKPRASSTQLNGELITEESATEYWFAYGPAPAQGSEYPNKTTVQTTTATGSIDVSQEISGLTPGMTYYGRMFARNPEGEVEEGDQQQFSVPPAEEDASPGPRVIVDPNGAMHVFYRQTDGNLGHQWLVKGSESWSGEVRPANSMAGDPRVLYDSSGVLHVFYRQTDGNLGHQWIAPGAPNWGAEVRPVSSMAGDPTVIVDPDGAIHVFYRQTDGNMGHQWLVKGSESWSGEVRPVSSMASDPRVIYDKDKALHVLYAESSGNIGHQWINYGASWWGGESRPVNSVGSAPKPLIDASNVFHIFYRQTDGHMGHQWIPPGGAWGGVVHPVSSMSSGPVPLLDTSKVLHTFYEQTDGNLGHQWLPSGSETWAGEVRPVSSVAPRPPVASTGAASGLEGNSVTLKGTVVSEGSMTEYYFEYGTTTAYGSKLPIKSAGDASGEFAISEALTGLAPSTTYHYRLVATSGEGTSKGSNATFTSAKFPIVATKPATGVMATQVTLPGSVNPNGAATTYRFEYGPTTAYGSSTSNVSAGAGTAPVAVSETIAGLGLETLYHYRLVATNSQGTARGPDMTFTTNTLGSKLTGLAVNELFDGSAASLTRFGSEWSSLGWASGATPKGKDTSTGWQSPDGPPSTDGAYFATSLTDAGNGIATSVKVSQLPSTPGERFSLWLDMATPGGAKAGYELRFTETGGSVYEAKLSKWQAGVQTVLGTVPSIALSAGNSIGLTDKGGSVIGWTDSGSGFGQLMAASDTAFSGGKAGVEAAGSTLRLTDFKAGTLLPTTSGVEGRWYLRNATAGGAADIEFIYGGAELLPVIGDWNGDGVDTPGAYKPTTGEWFLRNSSTGGSGQITFTFGGCCDLLPVSGDWNKDGVDTPGLYKPSEGWWFLRNSNTGGGGEINFIYGGGAGTKPIAGDWNNDGTDTIGIQVPATGWWHLRNTNTAGGGDVNFIYGGSSEMAPLVGDWNNDGTDSPGLFKQNGEWFLRNSNTAGAGEINFLYGGGTGSKSVGGDWNGDGSDTVGMVR